MKIELELTHEQFGLLIDLVKDKYRELDEQDTNWSILHDTSNNKEYNKQIKRIQEPLENFQTIYEQLLNY